MDHSLDFKQFRNLAGVDFNLIKSLVALIDHQGVSRAAIALGVRQSAMSASLKKLRLQFQDEILTRTPGGMIATDLGFQLGKAARKILALSEDLYLYSNQFDPKTTQWHIHMGTSSFVLLPYTYSFFRDLQSIAPGLSFSLIDASLEDSLRAIVEHRLDAYLGVGRAPDILGLNKKSWSEKSISLLACSRHYETIKDQKIDSIVR